MLLLFRSDNGKGLTFLKAICRSESQVAIGVIIMYVRVRERERERERVEIKRKGKLKKAEIFRFFPLSFRFVSDSTIPLCRVDP